MYVEQHWRISELEEVGSIIARVRAEDAENDILQFDLEPHYLNTGKNSNSYPFRIDPATGIVYLNETLKGRGGENFFLYITVTDGQLTAKNEVYVNILKSGDKKLYDNRTPSFTQTVRNLSQVLPPFHLLPGVINRPPGNIGNISPQFPLHLPPPPTPTNQEEEEVSKTKLTKVDNIQNSTQKEPVESTTNTILSLSEYDPSSYKIILAITLTLLVVFIIAICIGLYLKGRRNAFNFGGKFNKKGKADMMNKANLSNNFTSNTDESHNSMVMNNWIGPLAQHNRYVPWERDSQQVVCF